MALRPYHPSLADGGRHAEDNLQAVLAAPHREKTAVEAQKERAKARRIHAKHFRLLAPIKARLQGRPFQKSRPEPVMTGDSEEKKGTRPDLGSSVAGSAKRTASSRLTALAGSPWRRSRALERWEFDLPEGVANARLIAAAPALLAALQAIVWGDGYDNEGPDGID